MNTANKEKTVDVFRKIHDQIVSLVGEDYESGFRDAHEQYLPVPTDYIQIRDNVVIRVTLHAQDDGGEPYPVVNIKAMLKDRRVRGESIPAYITEVFAVYPHKQHLLKQYIEWAEKTVLSIPIVM